MNKLIYLILVSTFCFSWAEVKVEKVFEAKSIKEYNQWVQKNKERYPELTSCYLKVECIKWGKEWKIYYFNDEGNLIKDESLRAKPGWWLYVNDYPSWGKILIVESDSSLGESSAIIHTVKNEHGEEIFSFKWNYNYSSGAGVYILPGGIGLFRSKSYDDVLKDGYAELFTWDGKEICKIDHLLSIDMVSASEMTSVATPDKKFIVLGGSETAFFVDNGKYLWQKNHLKYLSISNNGEYICGGTNTDGEGNIYVYNRTGILLYSYKFADNSWSQPRSTFSLNNRYLVTTFGGQMVLLDNFKGQMIWQKESNGAILSFAQNDNYIVTIDKKSQTIYVYDTLGNVRMTINVPYGEDVKKKRTTEGKIIEQNVHYSNWTCEVHGDLIITKSAREWHPMIFRLK